MKAVLRNFIGRTVAMTPAAIQAIATGGYEEAAPFNGVARAEEGGVAVLSVSGVIAKDVGADPWLWAVDVDLVAAELERLAADPAVEAIVLDFDSPGGGVCGVPELATAIAGIEKPVVAFTDSMMCSAAYWLASGADAILASGSADVGSIGCYCAVLDESRFADRVGIKVNLLASGKYKGAGYPGTEVTQEQLDLFMDGVLATAEEFKAAVLEHREVPAEAMEGQSYGGKDAVGVGLVDGLGSLKDAVELARTLAAMKAKE